MVTLDIDNKLRLLINIRITIDTILLRHKSIQFIFITTILKQSWIFMLHRFDISFFLIFLFIESLIPDFDTFQPLHLLGRSFLISLQLVQTSVDVV